MLDNCEHVIGAAAACARGCWRLAMICGCWRPAGPLRVAGEASYRLASLALPDLDDLAEAAGAEAVALFADRARDADAHFTLDDQTALAVARLVTRLDGIRWRSSWRRRRWRRWASPVLGRLDER